ncbi:MAG TPA: YtxH domain-containing protein [Pelobium sp.]|nr:YtxH domain-containing protein [Pelobium sp.]
MKLFKLIALGAAVSFGYNYLTKRDELGRSKLDQIKENGPDWIEKGKRMASDAINDVRQKNDNPNYANKNY